MKTTIITLCWAGVLLLLAPPVQAENWAFRRSYFSHVSSAADYDHPDLPQSRTPYRLPYKDINAGSYVRGGFRFNTTILRNGNSTDRTFRTEWNVELVR